MLIGLCGAELVDKPAVGASQVRLQQHVIYKEEGNSFSIAGEGTLAFKSQVRGNSL